MKVGTKSVLYGAHCFLIHPVLVFVAWWHLYGFPWDPRLWVAFIVHDWGYWGKPNMDGPEGEAHVELGAKIMGKLFGPRWADFARYHSRYYSRRDGVQPSKLCYADKLAFCCEGQKFYLLRVKMSGEIKEYVRLAANGRDARMNFAHDTYEHWHQSIRRYLLYWVGRNYKRPTGQ